jgi:hypothetical protein
MGPALEGTLDPHPVVKELDAAIPKNWRWRALLQFSMTHLRDRPAGKYHIPRNNGKAMLIDGHGSPPPRMDIVPLQRMTHPPKIAGPAIAMSAGADVGRGGRFWASPVNVSSGASRPIDLTLRLSAMRSFTGNLGKIAPA